MKVKFNNRGFTLIEVIVAIAVIVTALIGSVALISFSVSSTRTSRSRIIAEGLTQEGLEIVRNIRDNNWLNFKRKASDWRQGLGEGEHRVQYNVANLLFPGSVVLKVDSNGFYQYDTGTDTSFFRKITLDYMGTTNQIKVTSEVTWNENGRQNSVKAELMLYNWLEEPET